MSTNKITRDGSFRGYAVDWGISLSSEKECPQWVLEIILTEYWNEDDQCWVDYTEMEEGITCYLTMVSGAGKVLKNCEQVMKVFSWDGMDWDVLAEGDYSDLKFQVRIKDNDPEYTEKNPYQVAWLDEYDATPGGGVQKLDKAGLKKLNTKFAAVMKKKFGGAAAKSAPTTAPVNPKGKATTAKEKMERNNEQTKKDHAAKEDKATKAATLKVEKAALAEKKKAEKIAKGKGKMPPFKADPPAEEETAEETTDDAIASMTQDEAWEGIMTAQEQLGDDCGDDDVNAALTASIKEVGESEAPDVDSFTGEQWADVCEKTKRALVGV